MAKYIKFLKPLKDRDTQFSIKAGEEIPLDHMGISEELGLYYCMIINEQKYYLPERFNKNQFEIVQKEE